VRCRPPSRSDSRTDRTASRDLRREVVVVRHRDIDPAVDRVDRGGHVVDGRVGGRRVKRVLKGTRRVVLQDLRDGPTVEDGHIDRTRRRVDRQPTRRVVDAAVDRDRRHVVAVAVEALDARIGRDAIREQVARVAGQDVTGGRHDRESRRAAGELPVGGAGTAEAVGEAVTDRGRSGAAGDGEKREGAHDRQERATSP
jgi:hypothetical protein